MPPAQRRATTTEPVIVTDLDQLEKEGGDKPPFATKVNGETIVFKDVRDLPWDELSEMSQDPDEFMWKTLDEDDYNKIKKAKIPGWKIEVLMADYRAHYGIGQRARTRG